MSDPVKPDDPPRRIADENVLRKRATDPRLRLGALGSPSEPSPPPPPLPPPPLDLSPAPPPSLLGLPGQALPAIPDFDAPTVAQEIPAGGFALPVATRATAPASDDPFDGAPATIADAGLPAALAPPPPPRPTPVAPARPPPPAPVAPARPPPPPAPPAAEEALFDDEIAPAIRPAPEVSSGGRARPVRERQVTAPAMPVPTVGDGGGLALDPPIEPSTPRVRPTVALDPPIEPSTPRARPSVALDPPIEPSTPRARPSVALDDDLPAPPGRTVSRAGADPTAPPDDAPVARRRASLLGPLVVGAVVVLVAIGLVGGQRGREHRYSLVEERQLADLWLDGGARAWGGLRQDAVVRAVEQVGAGVARAMGDHLDGRTPRFVVVNDDAAVQAFALPDATVVVTTATLRRLGSEAQLAALLAHTLAHVALGDVATHLDRAVDAEPAVRQALGGGAPQAAIELVTAAATAPQSAPRELEADALARDALVGADYTPTALADVLRNFGVRGGKRRAAWLNLHPDDPARIAAAEQASAGGRSNEAEYGARILDVVGRFGPAAPPAEPTTTPPPERKSGLRTLPPAPARPATPAPTTVAPIVPPDEAPPQP